MTKRLILIRHAKSAWDDPLTPDHDRPLNARGEGAARDLGQWLASRGYVPQEILCSNALRTRATWDGIAPFLPDAPEPTLKPATASKWSPCLTRPASTPDCHEPSAPPPHRKSPTGRLNLYITLPHALR